MHLKWTGSENVTDSPATVILAHGFGANMYDLAGIADAVSGPAKSSGNPELRWLFPQAPVELQPGSYAWFPSDGASLERIFRGEYFNALEELSLPELDERADQLVEDGRALGVNWENSFLGGFSQGSMLALRTQLSHRLPVRGLLLLSSALTDRKALENLLPPAPKVPVFQSHGLYDNVLPPSGAEKLRRFLEEQGRQVEYHSFPGMHSIPDEIIDAMTGFIRDRLP